MKRIILISILVLSACTLSAVRTFNLQAAIDAAPNGGTVNVPRGVWEGDAIIPAEKYVHIQGVSPAMLGQSPGLGSPQWDGLLNDFPNNFLNGSILRGHITSTDNASKLSMTNINMIGHGEGVGVSVANTPYGGVFENVSIGNYETGISVVESYGITINRMQLSGVGTGMQMIGLNNEKGGNLIRLRDVDIMTCKLGADLKGHIMWDGGSVQDCGEGIRMWSAGAFMSGIWFEGNDGAALVWDGYGGQLSPNFYATNGGNVVIDGWNNNLDLGWVVSAELTNKSQSNLVTISGGELINNGWNNNITP